MSDANDCELCSTPGGTVLWSNERLRVVRVDDPDYPGFLRVIWQAHVREMSDLGATHRSCLLDAVFAAERVLIQLLHPDNVIPRFRGDPHFPDPVWAVRRAGTAVALPMPVADYERAVTRALAQAMPA